MDDDKPKQISLEHPRNNYYVCWFEFQTKIVVKVSSLILPKTLQNTLRVVVFCWVCLFCMVIFNTTNLYFWRIYLLDQPWLGNFKSQIPRGKITFWKKINYKWNKSSNHPLYNPHYWTACLFSIENRPWEIFHLWVSHLLTSSTIWCKMVQYVCSGLSHD